MSVQSLQKHGNFNKENSSGEIQPTRVLGTEEMGGTSVGGQQRQAQEMGRDQATRSPALWVLVGQ